MSLTDLALAALFAARGISPAAPWNDAFDAAEQLLKTMKSQSRG